VAKKKKLPRLRPLRWQRLLLPLLKLLLRLLRLRPKLLLRLLLPLWKLLPSNRFYRLLEEATFGWLFFSLPVPS